MGMWNYLLKAANGLVSGIRPWRVISGVLVSAAITALGGFLIIDKVKQPNLPEQQLAFVSLIFPAFCLVGLFAGGIMIGWKTQRSWASNIFLYFLAVAWAIPCLEYLFLDPLSFESLFTVFNTFSPITSAGLAAVFGGGALGRGAQLLLSQSRSDKAFNWGIGKRKGKEISNEPCDIHTPPRVFVLNVSFLLLFLLAADPIISGFPRIAPVFSLLIDDGVRVLKRALSAKPPLIDSTSQDVLGGLVKYLLQQDPICRVRRFKQDPICHDTSLSSESHSCKERYVLVDSKTKFESFYVSDSQSSGEFERTNSWWLGGPEMRGILRSVSEHPEGFAVALPTGFPGKVIDVEKYECGPLTCPMKPDLWFGLNMDLAWHHLLASYPDAACRVSVWPVGYSSNGTKAVVKMSIGPDFFGGVPATGLLEKYEDGWKVIDYERTYS